jgi:septal ring factor EnvC (AmiA/AmiB activator)
VIAIARTLLGGLGLSRWLAWCVLALALAGGLALGWLQLEAARRARDQAIAAEAAARAELEQARAALARVDQERARARETARAAEARNAAIRREIEAMRARLAAATDGRSRCEAALAEIRRGLAGGRP